AVLVAGTCPRLCGSPCRGVRRPLALLRRGRACGRSVLRRAVTSPAGCKLTRQSTKSRQDVAQGEWSVAIGNRLRRRTRTLQRRKSDRGGGARAGRGRQ